MTDRVARRAARLLILDPDGSVFLQLHDDVEIGANCSIDRGVSADTIIGKGTKMDNQIHLGHDTVVGEMCLFAAGVSIAGVVTVEDRVTLWGRVAVTSDVVLGKGAVVLGSSAVSKSLEGGKTYFGAPAAYMGEGGSIPFMGMLGEKFPKAQFLITGVLGPHSNAHGPNEFLHIPTGKKVSMVVADVVARHYQQGAKG